VKPHDRLRIQRLMKRIATVLVLSLFALSAFAIAPVNKTKIRGLAIEGYDPVAYFTQSKPVKGSGDYEHEWNDATWRFTSAANRDAFAKNPQKYAPQYGGYCAFGVSRGYAVGIDPAAWSIVGGKLYLNYNLDVQKEWSKDVPGYIKKADTNWPKVLKGE
jgi:hypothetical protein